jgi:hypothetical protein
MHKELLWANSWKTSIWKAKKTMSWKDNIKNDFKELICEDEKWMELLKDYIQW